MGSGLRVREDRVRFPCKAANARSINGDTSLISSLSAAMAHLQMALDGVYFLYANGGNGLFLTVQLAAIMRLYYQNTSKLAVELKRVYNVGVIRKESTVVFDLGAGSTSSLLSASFDDVEVAGKVVGVAGSDRAHLKLAAKPFIGVRLDPV